MNRPGLGGDEVGVVNKKTVQMVERRHDTVKVFVECQTAVVFARDL